VGEGVGGADQTCSGVRTVCCNLHPSHGFDPDPDPIEDMEVFGFLEEEDVEGICPRTGSGGLESSA
jgi:hypothetical protein